MALNFMNKDNCYAQYDIGEYTYGKPRIESWKVCNATLTIGKYCSIARDVTIYLGGDHHTDWISTAPLANYFYGNRREVRKKLQVCSKGNVVIGNDVWIAANATILSGVKIGDGAVIGAHAVVAKSVLPYAIAVGNPATVVKKRFSDDAIEKLLAIKWWDWEDDKIRENIPLLLSGKIEDFVNKHHQS